VLPVSAAPARATLGPWISRGVQLVRAQLGTWLLLSLVSLLPGFVGSAIVVALCASLAALIVPRLLQGPDIPVDLAALQAQLERSGPILMVVLPVASLATVYLVLGMYRAALRQVDGGVPALADLGTGGGNPGRALGAVTLASLFTLLGTLLCVVPGLVIAGRLQFAVLLAMDRDMSPGEAVRASWDATRGDSLGFTLHGLVVGTLASLGSYLFGVGMVLTWPLLFTATAVAYRDLFGPRRAAAPAL
jgi:hypothetical protein